MQKAQASAVQASGSSGDRGVATEDMPMSKATRPDGTQESHLQSNLAMHLQVKREPQHSVAAGSGTQGAGQVSGPAGQASGQGCDVADVSSAQTSDPRVQCSSQIEQSITQACELGGNSAGMGSKSGIAQSSGPYGLGNEQAFRQSFRRASESNDSLPVMGSSLNTALNSITSGQHNRQMEQGFRQPSEQGHSSVGMGTDRGNTQSSGLSGMGNRQACGLYASSAALDSGSASGQTAEQNLAGRERTAAKHPDSWQTQVSLSGTV